MILNWVRLFQWRIYSYKEWREANIFRVVSIIKMIMVRIICWGGGGGGGGRHRPPASLLGTPLWYCSSEYLNINADGLAVDWISDKLYYHDRCHDDIGVLDLITNLCKTIVSGSDVGLYGYFHTDIIVDPTTRLV